MPDSAGVLREAQVGGGEAERAAELLAAHHPAADRIGAAQQARRIGEIAAAQCFADAGAGNALALQLHGFDFARRKAQLRAHPLQQRQIAATAVAEAEIRADPDFARAQAPDQHPAHEILGAHRRQARIEAQQPDAVGTQFAQALVLAAGQGQARRRQRRGKRIRAAAARSSGPPPAATNRGHGRPHGAPAPDGPGADRRRRRCRPRYRAGTTPRHRRHETACSLP